MMMGIKDYEGDLSHEDGCEDEWERIRGDLQETDGEGSETLLNKGEVILCCWLGSGKSLQGFGMGGEEWRRTYICRAAECHVMEEHFVVEKSEVLGV